MTVDRDLRRQAPAGQSSSGSPPGGQVLPIKAKASAGAELEQDLADLLQEAKLTNYSDQALAWCLDAGAVDLKEVLGSGRIINVFLQGEGMGDNF